MVLQGLHDHGLIYDFTGRLGWSPYYDAAANTLLIIIPAALAISFLAYNGIEAPFMRLRGVYAKRAREADKADKADDDTPAGPAATDEPEPKPDAKTEAPPS